MFCVRYSQHPSVDGNFCCLQYLLLFLTNISCFNHYYTIKSLFQHEFDSSQPAKIHVDNRNSNSEHSKRSLFVMLPYVNHFLIINKGHASVLLNQRIQLVTSQIPKMNANRLFTVFIGHIFIMPKVTSQRPQTRHAKISIRLNPISIQCAAYILLVCILFKRKLLPLYARFEYTNFNKCFANSSFQQENSDLKYRGFLSP